MHAHEYDGIRLVPWYLIMTCRWRLAFEALSVEDVNTDAAFASSTFLSVFCILHHRHHNYCVVLPPACSLCPPLKATPAAAACSTTPSSARTPLGNLPMADGGAGGGGGGGDGGGHTFVMR